MVPQPDAPSAPAISSLDQALLCPLCEYDLRATTEPRCPECGYQFDLEELRDPSRRLHPYLFEHHPERNFSSFWQTLLGGLRPLRFWETLHPLQPSQPRRLLLYWVLTSVLLCIVLAAKISLAVYRFEAEQASNNALTISRFPASDPRWQQQIAYNYGSVEAYVATTTHHFPERLVIHWVMSESDVAVFAITAIMWLAWPWITLAGLLIFQISMRRARVRAIHVMRVVVYSGDIAFWWALLLMGIGISNVVRFGLGRVPPWLAPQPEPYLPYVATLLLLVGTWRIAAAYRRYLRFPHALLTAIAVQIMVALLAFKLMLDWNFII